MKKPKISIIIPVYNGANYVKEAIDSALNQTYDNIEIIVVNDGSSDNTEKICKSYGNKIRYFYKENGGVSSALNLAIKNMTGDYFSWLSHDDRYYPTKIEENINYIGDKNIVFSNYDLIDKKSKVFHEIKISSHLIESHNEFALLNGLINGITLLIPKKAFDECGLFDESLRCTQDYEMWYRMILKGYKFVFINKVLASSRVHEKQTGVVSPKVLTEGNKLWIDMYDNLPDSLIKSIYGNKYYMYREAAYFLKSTDYKEAYNFFLTKIDNYCDTKINENPKVSVIMPFYDENLDILKRAIDSIVNQTYSNLEIIVINDNPDKYNETDLKKIFTDKRIKYIKNKKNMGVSSSRNIAINKSSGSYICFLDADDMFLDTKIEKQVTEMIRCNANFSHTSYFINDENNSIYDSGHLNGYVIPYAISNCTIATPTVMLNKDFVVENSFYFNDNLALGEDTCLWLQMCLKTPLLGIEEPLSKVFIDEDSSAYNDEKQIKGLKNILTFVINNEKLNIYDDDVAKLANEYAIHALKLNSYNSELQQILNSKSWKLTAPLRLLSKTIRSVKNNGIIGTIKKIKRYLCKK